MWVLNNDLPVSLKKASPWSISLSTQETSFRLAWSVWRTTQTP